MPDYLSCGGCQSDFELSDILQFIQHKRYDCHIAATPDFAMELLECVKCLRKFHTPWPLLLHVQSEHHIAVVRNLVLPSMSPSPSRQPSYLKSVDTKTVQTQTVKTCLKRLVCPYQANLPAECCLKVEAPAEESCCCLETGEKMDTSSRATNCQSSLVLNSTSVTCQDAMNMNNTAGPISNNSGEEMQSKEACPCEANSFNNSTALSTQTNTLCCQTSNNIGNQCNRFNQRSRVQSCCDPTQTLLSLPRNSDGCQAKKAEKSRMCYHQSPPNQSSSCCPCKPNSANTVDQTCQTDFAETFDIDMDLLLDTDDFNAAIDTTFHEENTHSNILAPSKAIQTVVHGSNFANYSITAQDLIPSEIIPVVSEPSQSETQSFQSSSVGPPSHPLSQTMNHYQRTYSTTREDVRAPFIYNQETSSTIENINATSPTQLWDSGEVPETSDVDHQESLLHLLGPSSGLAATSFTKTHLSQRQTTQLMEASQITVSNREHHTLRIEAMEPRRKRNARDYRFNCSDCDKAFRQNVHLRKHIMAKHTKQKPHKCTYCRYTTVEKSHLTVHIRTHTGEKPFRCRICNYSTAQNCTLKSHYLRKHPESKVKCNICGTDFITNHERDKHEKVCRRDDNFTNIDMRPIPESTFSKVSTERGNDITV